jgi:hypothetical protein
MTERRRKSTSRKIGFGKLTLITEPGSRFAAKVDGVLVNRSEGGVCVEVAKPLPLGMSLQVDMKDETGQPEQWEGSVCWLTVVGTGGTYRAGIEARKAAGAGSAHTAVEETADDLYEILQVNAKADFDMIHRVYRMLAQRYHPDHRETGTEEKFQRLLNAYQILSDPEKRAAYDVKRAAQRRKTWDVFRTRHEGDGVAAERRKRAMALAVMYRRRLREPETPQVMMRELEDVLGIEKEHLEFSLWYLRERGLAVRSDNGRWSITVAGVDVYEETEIQHSGGRVEPLAIAG